MSKDSHDEERGHKKRDDEDRDHEEEQDLSAAGPFGAVGPSSAAGPSGQREQRTVHLRLGDKQEVRRVLRTRTCYKSLSRVLQDHLLRSLLPRIEAGLLSPRRLALEVSGRKAEPPPREPVQVSLRNWASLENAARAANRGIRRLERKVAWRGSLRPFPFCRLGPAMIVRAAAREIAVATRGGDSRFFSREWTWGEGTLRGEGGPKSEGTPRGGSPGGKEPSGSALGGGEPGGDSLSDNSPNGDSPNGDSQNGGGSNDNSSTYCCVTRDCLGFVSYISSPSLLTNASISCQRKHTVSSFLPSSGAAFSNGSVVGSARPANRDAPGFC